ncbi:hypothetical protein [Leptospira sp. id769339]|uniref:hypothetical protein n=1 Tax=Leptospira sp. id769339 TaxID=2864221 RepID=UPI00214C7251|nr:hypothetical protein [Leptospira sp. id769339]MCR1794892.1 hypothetical protein [Leptospira sp. id769339]
MLDQIIFQQVSQLTHNGIIRGLTEKEATSVAEQTVTAILSKTKEIASKYKDPNQTLIFQQVSQISIGKILGGADPLQSVEDAASTIGNLLSISKRLTENSGLLDQ